MTENNFNTNQVTARGDKVPEHLLKTDELVVKSSTAPNHVIHPEDDSGQWQVVEEEETTGDESSVAEKSK